MQPLAGMNGNRGQQVQQVLQHPFGKPAPVQDLGAITEAHEGVIWARPQVNWSPGVLQTLSKNDRQGEPLKGVHDP